MIDREILRRIAAATTSLEPFAVATVIAVRGSASAKPGAKALIDAEGRNVYGWVGGGCADAYVREQAVEAMKEGRPRTVVADLDDEIFGLGMPCGGVMDVFIEPHAPPESLSLPVPTAFAAVARHVAFGLGYELTAEGGDETPMTLPAFLCSLGKAVAEKRGATFAPLCVTQASDASKSRASTPPSTLLLCGASRITEELARLGALLKWPVTVYGGKPDPGDYPERTTFIPVEPGFRNFVVPTNAAVVVASHHKGDPDYLRIAVTARAAYVGMIASRKRSALVLADLESTLDATQISAPAGLDIGCRTPADIALSIVCEILD